MKGQNLNLLEKQQLVDSYQSEIKKLQFQISLLKEAVNQLKEGIREDKKISPSIEATAQSIVTAMQDEQAPKATTAKRKPGRPKSKAASTPKAKATTASTGKRRGRPKKVEVAEVTQTQDKATSKTVKRGPGRPSATAKKKVSKGPGRPKTTAKSSKSINNPTAEAPKKRGRKPNQKLGGYRLSDWDNLIVDGITTAGKALIKSELLDLAAQKNTAEKLGLDEQALNVKISQSLHKLANRRDDLVKVSFPGRGFAYALSSWKTSKGDLPKKYIR